MFAKFVLKTSLLLHLVNVSNYILIGSVMILSSSARCTRCKGQKLAAVKHDGGSIHMMKKDIFFIFFIFTKMKKDYFQILHHHLKSTAMILNTHQTVWSWKSRLALSFWTGLTKSRPQAYWKETNQFKWTLPKNDQNYTGSWWLPKASGRGATC